MNIKITDQEYWNFEEESANTVPSVEARISPTNSLSKSLSRELSLANDNQLEIEFANGRRNSRRVTPVYTEGLNVGPATSRRQSVNSQKWAFGTQLADRRVSVDKREVIDKRASIQLKNVKFQQPVVDPNFRDGRARSNTTPTKKPEEIKIIIESFKPRIRIHGSMRSDHSISSLTDSLRASISGKDISLSKNSSSDGIRSSNSNTHISLSPSSRSFQRERMKSAGPPTSTDEVNRKEELARLHEKRLSAFRSIPAPAAGARSSRILGDGEKRGSRLSHVWVAEVQEQSNASETKQQPELIPLKIAKIPTRARAKSAPGRLGTGNFLSAVMNENPLSAH